MTAPELQAEIRKLIAEMGWTQAEAARCVHCEISESDDEEEIGRYIEAFKKRLKRATTSPDHLRAILDILSRQGAAERLGKVKPAYVAGPILDPAVKRAMLAISREFDRDIQE